MTYKNLYNFLLRLAFPILVSVGVLVYSYSYLDKKILKINHKFEGLKKIEKPQKIIVDIQKIREVNSLYPTKNIDTYIKKAKLDSKHFINYIADKAKTVKLAKKIDLELKSIIQNIDKKRNFDFYSTYIEKLMRLQQDISFHTNIVVSDNKKEYIFSCDTIDILPNLIEYNTRLREIVSSVKNKKMSNAKNKKMIVLLSKIDEYFRFLKIQIQKMNEIQKVEILQILQKNMINAQTVIIMKLQKLLIQGHLTS